MNRKVTATLLIMLISIVFTCGCYRTGNVTQAASGDEIEALKQKYEQLEAAVANLQKDVENLERRFQEEMTVVSSTKKNKEVLPIYRANINDYSREVGMYIDIPSDKTLRERLDIAAQKISEFYFEGLPIEVSEIKVESDGRKIAVVNLKESQENQAVSDRSKYKGPSWAVGYFQGSTGGTETSVCLIETFLQKDYKGEWIDGVRFTYEGGTVENFEHIPNMANTSFR